MSVTFDKINERLAKCKNYNSKVYTNPNPWGLDKLNDNVIESDNNKLCLDLEINDYQFNPIGPLDSRSSLYSYRKPQNGNGLYEYYNEKDIFDHIDLNFFLRFILKFILILFIINEIFEKLLNDVA